MTRVVSIWAAALIAATFTFSADAAQRRAKQAAEPPPPPPPQFKVDVSTRTMSIDRFIISIPVRTEVGKFTEGCFAMSALNMKNDPLYSDHAFRNVPEQEFTKEFVAEAIAAAYNMASSQTGALFDTQERKAELIVGANILTLKENVCLDAVLGYSTNVRAEATMSVDWQVFDPLTKKILFRATNEGTANFTVKKETIAVAVDIARAAFRNAAKNILADPNFLTAVKDPQGGNAPRSDSLFPEAVTSSPAAPLQIVRLPLSTKDFTAQVDDLRKQVVIVRAPGGSGSGYFISDTMLLTNEHVISGFKQVIIKFLDGREIAAEVLTSDAPRDVALLKSQGPGPTGIPLHVDNPAVGSRVFVIGSPLRDEFAGTVTSGIVSALRMDKRGPFIQSDVAVTHGNSGGPMFDDKGNVIGMTDIGIPGADGSMVDINLFIPIADALKVLKIDFAPTAAAAK